MTRRTRSFLLDDGVLLINTTATSGKDSSLIDTPGKYLTQSNFREMLQQNAALVQQFAGITTPDYDGGSANTTAFQFSVEGGRADTTNFTDSVEGGNAEGNSIVSGGSSGTTVYGSQVNGGTAGTTTFEQTIDGGNA